MTGGSRSFWQREAVQAGLCLDGVRSMMSSLPLTETLVRAGMTLPSGRRSWLKSLW